MTTQSPSSPVPTPKTSFFVPSGGAPPGLPADYLQQYYREQDSPGKQISPQQTDAKQRWSFEQQQQQQKEQKQARGPVQQQEETQSLQQPPPVQERSPEQAAYEYLNNILNSSWQDPLEIEILPPELVQDEFVVKVIDNCIGVPKTLLILAFQYARLLLFQGLPHARAQGVLGPWEDLNHVMDATQIILLFDPTHLTACNARKVQLRCLLNPDFPVPNPSVLDATIRKELWLLDSLLSSPLKKHTKSPILWFHRRWLHEEFLEWVLDVQRAEVMGTKRMSILLAPSNSFGSNPIDPTEILWRSFIEPELRVICNSGERHPMNYYAWDFARKLFDSITDYADLNDLDLPRLLCATVEMIQQWCMTHLTDTSGWSFLLHLMGRITDEDLIARVFVAVGNVVIEYRYRQDPPWHFIRALLASDSYVNAPFRCAFVGNLQGWLEQEMEIKQRHEDARLKAKALTAVREEGPVEEDLTPRTDRDPRGDLPLLEKPYFDIVVRHLKWVKNAWVGEPRPAIFSPVTPSGEHRFEGFDSAVVEEEDEDVDQM